MLFAYRNCAFKEEMRKRTSAYFLYLFYHRDQLQEAVQDVVAAIMRDEQPLSLHLLEANQAHL